MKNSKNTEFESFMYMAVHELREPLRTSSIVTELLLRRIGVNGKSVSAEDLEFIRKELVRLENVIRSLELYIRVLHESGAVQGKTDLKSVLDQVCGELALEITRAGASVNVAGSAVVKGPERLYVLAIGNLIGNALKYSRDGVAPVIAVAISEERGRPVIRISDNGLGFDPRYRDSIFKPFYRLKMNAALGTGLGLAFVKTIVTACGGSIQAASDGEDTGATFTLRLRTWEGKKN
jgi:signal transduction histidine kinase